MSPDGPDQSGTDKAGTDRSRETAWERKKRLAAVFGDVLPDTTADERDDTPPSAASGEDRTDAWLRAQVPPHHGGH